MVSKERQIKVGHLKSLLSPPKSTEAIGDVADGIRVKIATLWLFGPECTPAKEIRDGFEKTSWQIEFY